MRWLLLTSVLILAACAQNDNRPAFDGHKYRVKVSKVDKQRDQFVVSASPVSSSLLGAREAGRYEATKYCVKQYGTSDVAWLNGPDAEDGSLTISKDKLELRGTCAP
jgi:hypothetical protein